MENIYKKNFFKNKSIYKILKDRSTSDDEIFYVYLQLILLCKRIPELT